MVWFGGLGISTPGSWGLLLAAAQQGMTQGVLNEPRDSLKGNQIGWFFSGSFPAYRTSKNTHHPPKSRSLFWSWYPSFLVA